jgi:hypothetical protein
LRGFGQAIESSKTRKCALIGIMSENYSYNRLPTVHETQVRETRDQDITEYVAAGPVPLIA